MLQKKCIYCSIHNVRTSFVFLKIPLRSLDWFHLQSSKHLKGMIHSWISHVFPLFWRKRMHASAQEALISRVKCWIHTEHNYVAMNCSSSVCVRVTERGSERERGGVSEWELYGSGYVDRKICGAVDVWAAHVQYRKSVLLSIFHSHCYIWFIDAE